MGTTTIFSLGHQSCTWPRYYPFWQNPCSGCNSGIDLVVVLEYTFFQLCSNAEQISARLARFGRSFVNRRAVVLTNHTSYTAFLLDVRCVVSRTFENLSCLSSCSLSQKWRFRRIRLNVARGIESIFAYTKVPGVTSQYILRSGSLCHPCSKISEFFY